VNSKTFQSFIFIVPALLALGWSTGATGAEPAKPGMRIEIDPSTGRIIEGAPVKPEAAEERARDSVKTEPTPEMKEERVQAPAGGSKVNIKGRFRNYTSATVDEDGALSIHCEQDSSGAARKKQK